jgi:hypothetical protein
VRGEYIVAAPLTDICGTMDSTVLHSDANLPNALLHHIVRLSKTHCFFRPLLCCVMLCSAPTCLLCCVLRYIFCLYVPVVLLCSASTTCLLSRPRQRAGDTTRVIQPPITPWLHRRQLNLFLKFSNMWSTWKVTAFESGG